MSYSHDDWYQQRYGDAQAQKEQQQARRQTRHDDSAAILAEHQIEYEVCGHSWLCNVGYQQIYYWPKSGKWRVKGRKTTYYSRGAQDFLNKVQRWQQKQLS